VQALLRDGAPIDAENDTVVLGFPFPFHRERIEEQKNRTVVEDVIGQVLGRKVRVRCAPATKEALAFVDPLQSAMEDPLVRAAISMGARVRRVTQESAEETE